MRNLPVFWTLYMLFFAIPFPMILYYNIKSEDPPDLVGANPWLSLFFVVFSMMLWASLLASYYNKWILRTLAIKRNIERLKNEGVKREAIILSNTDISRPNIGYSTCELNLSVKNLVGTDITQKLTVNDTRPYEGRFDAGKRIDVVIDQEMKQYPYFILASFKVSIKKNVFVLFQLGWLLIMSSVVAYYIYSYQLESEGLGWRFMSFYHPLMLCPVILLIGNINLIGRWISRLLESQPEREFLIKYKGLRANAKMRKASQTGTYINEQPMVNFDLEFVDDKNQLHRSSIKKIVDLLDLESTRQKEVAIFYLQEDPQQIAFATDLNELSIYL